jgi:hypothetical protein
MDEKPLNVEWYVGVLCAACQTPILVERDSTEGQAILAGPGGYELRCQSPRCIRLQNQPKVYRPFQFWRFRVEQYPIHGQESRSSRGK